METISVDCLLKKQIETDTANLFCFFSSFHPPPPSSAKHYCNELAWMTRRQCSEEPFPRLHWQVLCFQRGIKEREARELSGGEASWKLQAARRDKDQTYLKAKKPLCVCVRVRVWGIMLTLTGSAPLWQQLLRSCTLPHDGQGLKLHR